MQLKSRNNEYSSVREITGRHQQPVYVVQDAAGVQYVAKFDNNESDGYARFRREWHALNHLERCENPSIPRLIDVINSEPALIIPFYDGATLEELTATKTLSAERCVTLFSPIVRALDTCHATGIIHRDVKPANILVCREGLPVLLDFALACTSGAYGILHCGIGTPRYISPEAIDGEPIDGRADVYSLALTLFRTLTHASARNGDYAHVLMYQHRTQCIPSASELNSSVPTAVSDVLIRAAHPNRDERPDGVLDFWDEFSAAAQRKIRKISVRVASAVYV